MLHILDKYIHRLRQSLRLPQTVYIFFCFVGHTTTKLTDGSLRSGYSRKNGNCECKTFLIKKMAKTNNIKTRVPNKATASLE